jgi:predicted TIM-barrel fold metal-dependent hydrolase
VTSAIAQRIRIIDADSHVSEPVDLWTSRISVKRWGDMVPHVRFDPAAGEDRWFLGGRAFSAPASTAMAGWNEPPPDHPPSLNEADHGAWDVQERLRRMDEYGIWAQVLYPNLIGFESPLFMKLEPEIALACTRAYNDFISEWASADPKRLIPITMLPFWDLEASVAEMERCRAMGHRGVLFANRYEMIGLPPFYDKHWDPILAAAQDLDLSLNFHVGFSQAVDGAASGMTELLKNYEPRDSARATTIGLMGNAETIATVLTCGVCERFPRLKFVSVESGFGYIPYLMESLDWHWKGYGAHLKSPMLPSELFRRQVYGCFWFERQSIPLLAEYPDNFMFETDFPHPTSLAPGPCSPAELPSAHVAKQFAGVSPEVARKALHDNAARVYHLDD